LTRRLDADAIRDTNAKPAASRQTNDLDNLKQALRHACPGFCKGRQALYENFSPTVGLLAKVPPHLYQEADLLPTTREVRELPPVATMDPCRCSATQRAGWGGLGGNGCDREYVLDHFDLCNFQPLWESRYLLHFHLTKPFSESPFLILTISLSFERQGKQATSPKVDQNQEFLHFYAHIDTLVSERYDNDLRDPKVVSLYSSSRDDKGGAMRCKYCGQELPAGIHGKREYCNDAHKQAYYRQQVQREQREKAALIAEIEHLKAHVKEQNQEIQQHLWVITDLKRQLDLERRYLLDTQARGFISFLKRQPMTPLIQKILAGRYLPQTGTHWMYEHYLRHQRILVTDEDLLQFKDLWKVMLLESFRDDF
jgi:hypothetical protein